MKITRSNATIQVVMILLLSLIKSSHQTVYSCNPSASCGCSTNSATVNRIVGGEAASSATWSWAVSISIGGRYLCGGSIISSSWVITAAHCVNGYSASQITIYAGSTFRWSGTQRSIGSRLIVHPSYNSKTDENDIAMLKLASPLSMSDPYVRKICLPSVSDTTLSAGEWPAAGTTVVAVGWGTLNESGSLPNTLQQVTIKTVNYGALTCKPMYNWHLQLCAGVSGGGKDTCQGDSGGPLMMFNSSNQWVLVGLTSNGIGCARATNMGVYTRVAAYTNWINSNMDNSYSSSTSSTPTTIFSSTQTIASSTSCAETSIRGYTVVTLIFTVLVIVLSNLSIASIY